MKPATLATKRHRAARELGLVAVRGYVPQNHEPLVSEAISMANDMIADHMRDDADTKLRAASFPAARPS